MIIKSISVREVVSIFMYILYTIKIGQDFLDILYDVIKPFLSCLNPILQPSNPSILHKHVLVHQSYGSEFLGSDPG